MAITIRLSSKANIKSLTNAEVPYSPVVSGTLAWVITNALSQSNGSTLAISFTTGLQGFRVASSGGAATLALLPFGASKPINGAIVRLYGTSDTNTIGITNNDVENGCITNGNVVLVSGSTIEFQFIQGSAAANDRWVEIGRNF
jgi:hypothetical protein